MDLSIYCTGSPKLGMKPASNQPYALIIFTEEFGPWHLLFFQPELWSCCEWSVQPVWHLTNG